jgi:aspartate-semialdehyde dehydrogenase
MLPLKALHDAFGLRAFVATSFQAASGAGQRGIDELEAQVEPLFARRELLRIDGAAAAKLVERHVHARTLAFNVVPLLGTEQAGGYTDEEMKLCNESRKILGLPDLEVSPTCVRVPVMVGHALQIRATFSERVTAASAISAMEGFPGLLCDHAPTPLEWAGRDEVAVGRVRSDLADPHALNFWVTGDNLLKGAALNAVQLAELLIERHIR